MTLKRKTRHYNMSHKAAGDTLKNVLAACNIESDNINFELLRIKSIAQTNLVDTCKWITVGFLFLVLIAPVALINNDIRISSRGIVNERIIIEDHQLYSDHFVLKLIGNDIDYDSIYALDADGTTFIPTYADPETGMVEFPYGDESLTIYISDTHGHTLSATVSAYGEK